MKLGVSVVSLNRPAILKQTIDRLIGTLPPEVPVIVVDNGSSDPATLALLDTLDRNRANGWNTIRNLTNAGLSVAVNQGLSELYKQECDLLVHLDDDALITAPHKWTQLLCPVFERTPKLGLAVPNIYSESIKHVDFDEIRWGLGFAWALRRGVYDLIGGYDQQLLHQQECDLGLRVRMADYLVGALSGWGVHHNDPGTGERSEISKAREHIGVVQFVDKWTGYFRGLGWNYGTIPVYRMQQWPPDQEWYRRFAYMNKIELNPPPPDKRVEEVRPGERVLEIFEVEEAGKLSANAHHARRIFIGGSWYFCFVDLRNEYAHWARGTGYLDDRDRAIKKWHELTGELYGGYRWPINLLKV